jgi:hypothetical protein
LSYRNSFETPCIKWGRGKLRRQVLYVVMSCSSEREPDAVTERDTDVATERELDVATDREPDVATEREPDVETERDTDVTEREPDVAKSHRIHHQR